ncbi:MAG: hypothetical protein QOF45_2368 [Gaiellaceae bacterium]|nr:hypothetical protein [Gaiellaceae bacterium]
MLTAADLARYESPRGRANVASAVLLVILVADLVAIWSSQAEYSLLGRIDAGKFASAGELTRNDNRQMIIGYTEFGLFVVGVISFVSWFVQAYRNAEALGANGLRHSSSWALWSWFVPVLNLFRPKQIANDIWRASSPAISLSRQREWELLNPPVLLLAWWIAFLVSRWSTNLSRAYADASTAGALQSLDRVWMFGDSIDAVAAVLAIVVVTMMTRRLEARFVRATTALAQLA